MLLITFKIEIFGLTKKNTTSGYLILQFFEIFYTHLQGFKGKFL